MTPRSVFTWVLATLFAGAACGSQGRSATPGTDSTVLAAREARLEAAVSQADTGPIARWILPAQLNEISGVALTTDGRILTHGDQRGAVFAIDYRRGVVVKEFALGTPKIAHDDFEAITIVGDTVILLASTGKLYMFKEGANESRVAYTVHDTGLGTECEFEGMTFDPATRALLLACKVVKTPTLKGAVVIFRWKLGSERGAPASKLTVPLSQVAESKEWGGFHPSDITINPLNGNYVIIAGRQKAMLEITPNGKVVLARLIPGEHPQPEGIAITRDSILIISDEWVEPSKKKAAGGSLKLGPAVITLYRWPLAPVQQGTP